MKQLQFVNVKEGLKVLAEGAKKVANTVAHDAALVGDAAASTIIVSGAVTGAKRFVSDVKEGAKIIFKLHDKPASLEEMVTRQVREVSLARDFARDQFALMEWLTQSDKVDDNDLSAFALLSTVALATVSLEALCQALDEHIGKGKLRYVHACLSEHLAPMQHHLDGLADRVYACFLDHGITNPWSELPNDYVFRRFAVDADELLHRRIDFLTYKNLVAQAEAKRYEADVLRDAFEGRR